MTTNYSNPTGNFKVTQKGDVLTITVSLTQLMADASALPKNKFGGLVVASSYNPETNKKSVKIPLGESSTLALQLGVFADSKEWVKGAEPSKKVTTKDELASLREELAIERAENAEMRDIFKQFMMSQMNK